MMELYIYYMFVWGWMGFLLNGGFFEGCRKVFFFLLCLDYGGSWDRRIGIGGWLVSWEKIWKIEMKMERVGDIKTFFDDGGGLFLGKLVL